MPSSSQFLIESDLFLVAGRMLGHSFLHGGPCLAGLSRAFVHVLLHGSQDTATIQLEDCPDVDIRETINLVCLYLSRLGLIFKMFRTIWNLLLLFFFFLAQWTVSIE